MAQVVGDVLKVVNPVACAQQMKIILIMGEMQDNHNILEVEMNTQ
jgi:hypothetical protein